MDVVVAHDGNCFAGLGLTCVSLRGPGRFDPVALRDIASRALMEQTYFQNMYVDV